MDDSLEPSPAQLGDTMTLTAGEWTPLDDIGTEIYVYGDQPVDVAVQYAEVESEIRQLRADVAALAKGLLEIAEQAMPDTYFAADSRVQHARRILGDTA
ncbi:hypothetical protein ACQP2Y_21075 [Actinoplanes sp. CA-051413]|uniref:hypothetical protein n=1 Tax=Actinoplanes sp. CA-051413 TaxID=3239899 RepID=UPI003D957AC4